MNALKKGFGIFGSVLAAVLFEWAYVDTSKRHGSNAVSPRRRVYRREPQCEQHVRSSVAAA
jgi:hypothetical protein